MNKSRQRAFFLRGLGLALLFVCGGSAGLGAAEGEEGTEYPMVKLSNGLLQMNVYTPDSEVGFYRGTRFDWSGIIERVEYKGHRFYAPWRTPHQPAGNDFVSGPAGEFAMENPMGYYEAEPGETFVKVGVGLLERIDSKKYHFFGEYKLAQPGEWTVTNGADWIEFQQELVGERGWAYRYTKRISLGDGGPTFSIYHRLENTGEKTIDIDHYNHNFTSIDGVPFGPDYSVEFPFEAEQPKEIKAGLAWFRGNKIEVLKPLGKESLWIRLRAGGGAEYNSCKISNNKTGASILFLGDTPISEFRFWSVETAACPEPFIQIELEPQEAKEWRWNYVLSAAGDGD